MNEKTQADWDACSDRYFGSKDRSRAVEEIKQNPMCAFPREVRAMLKEAFPDFTGKKVLVPSCGNSYAVFAFHLLGAEVTASDLSSQQLKNARRIAESHGMGDIPFMQSDSMTLEGLPDGEFDLIHTSNGVHVWIGDLAMMYGAFQRVLRPGGRFIFFEVHPFHRPLKSGRRVKIVKPYTDLRGPSELEHHWRIEDFMRALLGAGFAIEDLQELMAHEDDHDGYRWYDIFAKYNWRKNPMAALPAWLAIRATKK